MEEGKLTMFGKTYNTVGNTDSNFLIRTKGDLKVQWGGKFIDVIKNGKLASAGSDILKTASSSDDISSNGIYLVSGEEGNEVWVSIDGTKVNIAEDIGTTYVSFLSEQKEVTADQKYTALTNAGFYYETLEDAQDAGIKAGIIFILEENKLYLAKGGQLSEYNPTSKNSEEKSTYFDEITIKDLKIYSDGSQMIIFSPSLQFKINEELAISIDTQLRSYLNIVMQSDTFIQSNNATSVNGYRLYLQNGKSVLEIDKVVVRESIELLKKYINVSVVEFRDMMKEKQLTPNQVYRLYNFRNFWELIGPEILEEDATKEVPTNVRPLIITAKGKESYYSDTCFFEEDEQCVVSYDISYNKQYIINGETVESLGLITRMKDQNNNECNYNFRHLQFLKDGNWVYTFQDQIDNYSDNSIKLQNIRVEANVNGAAVVFEDNPNYATFSVPCSKNIFSNQDAPLEIEANFNENTILQTWDNVKYKKITSCLFKKEVRNVTIESPLEGCTFEYAISNTDLFQDTTLVFRNCQFLQPISGSIEPPDANIRELLQSDEPKQIIFSTENGIKKLKATSNSSLNIPPGSIMMWHGTEIPYGWVVCDGENGTPNLVGRFIKAVATAEEVGEVASELNENNELTIKQENLPKHNHPHQEHTHNVSIDDLSGTTGDSGQLEVELKQGDYNYGITSTSKTVVKSVTGEGVTTETDTVESVGNIKIQGGAATGGNHNHSISIDAGGSATVSPTTSIEQPLLDPEWPNKPIKIEPRSYALIFIMKL